MTLLTQGIAAEFSQQVKFSELDTHISQLLESAKDAGNQNPIAVGVIPFSEHNPVHFIVPDRLITTSPIRPDKVSDVDGVADCPPSSIQPIPTPEEYMRSVELAATSCCREDIDLDKVVLSRTMQVDTEEEIDRARLLKTLLKQNPGGYTFSTRVGGSQSDAYLMGSSLNCLCHVKAHTFVPTLWRVLADAVTTNALTSSKVS